METVRAALAVVATSAVAIVVAAIAYYFMLPPLNFCNSARVT